MWTVQRGPFLAAARQAPGKSGPVSPGTSSLFFLGNSPFYPKKGNTTVSFPNVDNNISVCVASTRHLSGLQASAWGSPSNGGNVPHRGNSHRFNYLCPT